MVSGSLVSNKQSVNLSIISAHPVYESQRTRDRRAQIKTKSPLGRTIQMARRLAGTTGERRENADTNDRREEPQEKCDLVLDRVLYLETTDH